MFRNNHPLYQQNFHTHDTPLGNFKRNQLQKRSIDLQSLHLLSIIICTLVHPEPSTYISMDLCEFKCRSHLIESPHIFTTHLSVLVARNLVPFQNTLTTKKWQFLQHPCFKTDYVYPIYNNVIWAINHHSFLLTLSCQIWQKYTNSQLYNIRFFSLDIHVLFTDHSHYFSNMK